MKALAHHEAGTTTTTTTTAECRKRRYGSEDEAWLALFRLAVSASPHRPRPVRPYPCHRCQAWHLTSLVGLSR